MMLWFFVIGGLTVFNIFPGLINGFGEEFGHRGFMFTNLYPNKPWLGLITGGVLWYLWLITNRFKRQEIRNEIGGKA